MPEDFKKQLEIVNERLQSISDRLRMVSEMIEDKAAKIIRDEFDDILGSYDVPDDRPIKPFQYIDNNEILFYDAKGRFFFWDENFFTAEGPYEGIVETCQAMRKYNEQLNSEAQDV